MKYVKLTWPTGAIEVVPIDTLSQFLPDYLDGAEPGEQWCIDIIYMNEDEYKALPEFLGP